MEIKFVNGKGKVVSRTLEEGQKWEQRKTSNKTLNNIFETADDGDGVVSQLEIDTINRIIKEQDKNKNGILEEEDLKQIADIKKDGWEIAKKRINVALEIYNDIYAKSSIGFPTTGKNIDKHIQAVTEDNVWGVIKAYEDKTDGEESIFSGIMGEIGLKYSDRAKYCKHIIDMLVKRYSNNGVYIEDIVKEFNAELDYQRDTWTTADAKRLDAIVRKLMKRLNNADQSKNIAPNGKIDKDFSQGASGDCWLLASIKAISMSPKGLKILNDSIKIESNGDVTVTLKGVNKSYTFTQTEISGNTQLSTGDLDVRAIEMAVDKYIAEERGIESEYGVTRIDINGNNEQIAYKILLGKGNWDHFYDKDSIMDKWLNGDRYEIRQEHIDRFNDKNHIVCVSSHGKKDLILKEPDSNNTKLFSLHSYAVSRADSKYVYLINPHDTSKEIKVSIKTFKTFFNDIAEVDI